MASGKVICKLSPIDNWAERYKWKKESCWPRTFRRSYNSGGLCRIILCPCRNRLCNQPKPLDKNSRLQQRFYLRPNCPHVNQFACSSRPRSPRRSLFSGFSICLRHRDPTNTDFGDAPYVGFEGEENSGNRWELGFLVRRRLYVKQSRRHESHINTQSAVNPVVPVLGSHNHPNWGLTCS